MFQLSSRQNEGGQQRQNGPTEVGTVPDLKKKYSIPFEQTDLPFLASDDPKTVINALKPVRTVIDLSPQRGRNAIEQVTSLLSHEKTEVRSEAALTVEKIGGRLLKDEKTAKTDKDREDLRSARYYMLAGLAKQAEAETDKTSISRIQAAASKLVTAEEIAALRKSSPELADKIFGPEKK